MLNPGRARSALGLAAVLIFCSCGSEAYKSRYAPVNYAHADPVDMDGNRIEMPWKPPAIDGEYIEVPGEYDHPGPKLYPPNRYSMDEGSYGYRYEGDGILERRQAEYRSEER